MARVRWLTAAAAALCSTVLASAQPPVAPNLARLDQTLNGLDGPGLAVAFDESSGVLAASCWSGPVRCWRRDVSLGVRTGRGAEELLAVPAGPVTALAAGGRVLAANSDRNILLFTLPACTPLATLAASAPVRAVAVAPDGKSLAAAGDDPAVQIWDVTTGKPTVKLTGHTDWVVALAFSPDGKLLASGGFDGVVRLWELPTGKRLFDVAARPPPAPNTPPEPPNVVEALAFAPDGKTLAVGGSDPRIHLVNPADGKIIRSLPGHAGTVTGLAFHPSGTLLVSASKDRTVRLWNPANGQMLKSLEGHTSWVEGVTFVGQGTRLATVGADQTVRLWDLTDPAKK